MFIPLKFMMAHARENGYSISRFAVTNLESIEAVTQAAEISGSPIVYDIYEPELQNVCQSCLEFLIKKLGSETSAPVAIFSDHVQEVEKCKEIINKGYSGLMVDASRYSFEENVKITREVVAYAHRYGVFVEGELGIIESGREGDDTGKLELTDPELSRDFIQRTNVDCLAVSIGVKSGFYHGTPDIDYELLKRIKSRTDIHLSLHGCSGLSEDIIKRCVAEGVSFTAWATDIRYVFFEKIDEIRKEKGREYVIPGNILIPARDKMKDEIINKLRQGGSAGKGNEIVSLYKDQANFDLSNKSYSGQVCPGIEEIDINNLVKTITQVVLKEIKDSERKLL